MIEFVTGLPVSVSLLITSNEHNHDEVIRVAEGRRRMPVVQKVWDHYVARAELAGLMEGL